MATNDSIENVHVGSSRIRAGVSRLKRHSLKTDMTPMVDLGFLLISFFVITTAMSKPTSMNLYMPHDGPSTPVGKSSSIAFLLSNDNRVFYYTEELDEAILHNRIYTTTFTEEGIGKIISEKQKILDLQKGGREELTIIIKPNETSSYKNVVDMLDEMSIHDVKRYAIVKQTATEAKYLVLQR